MISKRLALSLLLLFILIHPSQSQEKPVLRVIDFNSVPAEEMLKNGSLEQASKSRFTGVLSYDSGYQVKAGEGIQGSTAAYCENDGTKRLGLYWSITLNQSTPQPVRFSGWSKAEEVEGSPDSEYSLYVDIIHQDGTPSWGNNVPFQTGNHDWQKQSILIIPDKPVKSISCYALFRGRKGKAWFDDFSLQATKIPQGMIRFDSLSSSIIEPVTIPAKGQPLQTKDGLSLHLDTSNGRISALSVSGKGLSLAETINGFLIRDVSTASDYYPFTDGRCETLQCNIEIDLREDEHAIHVQGKLKDLTHTPRAMNLVFAIPIEAAGWKWGEDARQSVAIGENTEYTNWITIGTGSNGKLSKYPFASIYSNDAGFSAGIGLANPCQWRLGYSAGAKAFYISMDFGLHPDTQNFPSQANFSFVLFTSNPKWGFRAAAEQYYKIFSPCYAVRSKDQGIWMPFTDISTVQGWQDFGFKYHEGNNNVPFDDKSGILSFRYSEPSTWWMSMPKDVSRTYEAAMQIAEQYKQSNSTGNRSHANALFTSGSFDSNQKYQMLFKNEPWTNGAVFSLNTSPYLQGEYTGASVLWNEKMAESLYGSNAKGELDGEYLDSLEGYVTADLNYRTEHFRAVTVPLTFTIDSRQPVIYKAFSIYEFTRYLSEKMHARNKLLFANGVPFRYSFLCPWLDIMGTETDWISNGQFSPEPDDLMMYRRVLCAAKPFLFLMNTDFNQMSSAIVEKYFLQCLFYGMYPSMFSHNAADNPYWQNATLYNRDRPLFQRYQPMIKKVAEAGWEPVTLVHSNLDSIWVERFGSPQKQELYLTVKNNDASGHGLTLQGENPFPQHGKWKELLSGKEGIWNTGLESTIEASSIQVYRIYDFEKETAVKDMKY